MADALAGLAQNVRQIELDRLATRQHTQAVFSRQPREQSIRDGREGHSGLG